MKAMGYLGRVIILFVGFAVFSMVSLTTPADETDPDILDIVRKIQAENRDKKSGEAVGETESGQFEALESAIGDGLAIEGFRRYGLPVKDPDSQHYVNLIGNALARNAGHTDIPFYFVIVNSPVCVSFACPGGIVFISSAFVESMEDEAELACLIAHEIAHMNHKHLLHAFRTGKTTPGFDGMMETLAGILFERGLPEENEFEADAQGMEIAYRTGYDPGGMIRILKTLENKKDGGKKGTVYETHPALSERIKRRRKLAEKYPDNAALARVKDRFLENRKRLSNNK